MAWLTMAYLRRTRFEARIAAVAHINAMGEAMGQRDRVPAETMIAMMGGYG